MTQANEIPRILRDEVTIPGIFPEDGRWGHRIEWEDYEERRVVGWITISENPFAVAGYIGSGRTVQEGDTFAYEMESGEVGVFELADVDNQDDPKDMFFADVNDVGYLEREGSG